MCNPFAIKHNKLRHQQYCCRLTTINIQQHGRTHERTLPATRCSIFQALNWCALRSVDARWNTRTRYSDIIFIHGRRIMTTISLWPVKSWVASVHGRWLAVVRSLCRQTYCSGTLISWGRWLWPWSLWSLWISEVMLLVGAVRFLIHTIVYLKKPDGLATTASDTI